MKKMRFSFVSVTCLCSLLLISWAGEACAAWVKLSENEIGDTFYYDTATIVKTDTRTIWILMNYGTPDKSHPQEILSVKYLMQANCSDKSTRELMSFSYGRPNGEGKPTISNESGGKWQGVQRNSPEEDFYKFLCKR